MMAIEDGFFVLECKYCLSRACNISVDCYAIFKTPEEVDERAIEVNWKKTGEHEHVCVPCGRKQKYKTDAELKEQRFIR